MIAAMIAVVAAVVGLAACSGSDPFDGFTPPPTPGAQPGAGSSAPADIDKDVQVRRAGRTQPQALGNLRAKPKIKTASELGAPFDPCAVPWTDFPEQVRPTGAQPPAPTPGTIDKDTKWDVDCTFDNSGPAQVTVGGDKPAVQNGAVFKVIVAWDKSGTADPAKNPGSEPKAWGARSGFLKPMPPDPVLGEGCIGSVRLQSATGEPAGAGLVAVSDARFPMPACEIVDAVIGAIARKNQ